MSRRDFFDHSLAPNAQPDEPRMPGGARCLSCQSQRFVAHNQNRPLARRHHALSDGAHQSFRETGTAVRAETNRVRIETLRGLRDRLRSSALPTISVSISRRSAASGGTSARNCIRSFGLSLPGLGSFFSAAAGGSITWTSFNVPPRRRIAQPYETALFPSSEKSVATRTRSSVGTDNGGLSSSGGITATLTLP